MRCCAACTALSCCSNSSLLIGGCGTGFGPKPEPAGVPPGVFNVVVGSRAAEIGGELCANAEVRKLGFTGSTAVGKLLMAQAAQTVTRVSLELGGHAPLLVFDDADVDVAVAAGLGVETRDGPLVLNDNPNEVGLPLGERKTEGCSGLFGNPCQDKYVCKDCNNRFEVAKKNGWKGHS